MSLTNNKFRRTKIYGDLELVDYTDASGSLYVERNITFGSTGGAGYFKYYDSSANLHSLNYTNLNKLETALATETYVNTAIAAIDVSNYLTTTDASNNYLKQVDASNNYAKITYVNSQISSVNSNLTTNYLTSTDTSNNYLKLTDASNNYAKITYVDTKVTAMKNEILGGASGAYDTLLEIQNILITDDASINSITTAIGTKLSITDASNNYLKIVDASNNYLKQTDASTTYLTKTNPNNTWSRITNSGNSAYWEIRPGYNYVNYNNGISPNDGSAITYTGNGAPYTTHYIEGNLFVGNQLSSVNGFLSIGNGHDLSRVRNDLNIDNVLRVGFNDEYDVGDAFSNGARIDVSGNINVSGDYTIGGTSISATYAGLASNNTLSGNNTFSGTIYGNIIDTPNNANNNGVFPNTTTGVTTICGNPSLSGTVTIAPNSSGNVNLANSSTGVINIGAGSSSTASIAIGNVTGTLNLANNSTGTINIGANTSATADINIGKSTGGNSIALGKFAIIDNSFNMPDDVNINGVKYMNNKTTLSQIGERIYAGTVTSNAITINYNTINGSIISIAPSSSANIALTITNINLASAGYFSYNMTFLIDTSTYKRYINSVTIAGTSYTPISANGFANITINSNTVYVLQTLNVIYLNSTTPTKVITNVASLY